MAIGLLKQKSNLARLAIDCSWLVGALLQFSFSLDCFPLGLIGSSSDHQESGAWLEHMNKDDERRQLEPTFAFTCLLSTKGVELGA